jgi:hypothetical protein
MGLEENSQTRFPIIRSHGGTYRGRTKQVAEKAKKPDKKAHKRAKKKAVKKGRKTQTRVARSGVPIGSSFSS